MAKGGFRGMPGGGMNQAAMMKQAQKMQQELLKLSHSGVIPMHSAAGMISAIWKAIIRCRKSTRASSKRYFDFRRYSRRSSPLERM